MNAAASAPPVAPEQLIERVQQLQERLEAAGAGPIQELADDLVSAIVQMYGAGLARVLGALLQDGEQGQRIAAGLGEDQLVATLLLIHDLHPVSLEQRVQGALDSVRPYMESHGGDVALLSLVDGVARIHLQGSCSDCSASSVTLELAIKQALEDAAPDLEGLEVEGVAPQATGLSLPMASDALPSGLGLPVVTLPAPAWFELDPDAAPAAGSLVAIQVAGAELVLANVQGTLLAYRDACAGCGGPLRDGRLSAGALACPRCERTFFLPRAGRSMDDDRVQLEPVPLLREQGRVKVALAG